MRRNAAWLVVLVSLTLLAAPSRALDADDDASGFERTPPRLGYADGEVSFSRQGAEEWSPAQVNTPLAPGDALYSADDANLELEVGSGAFVRAGERTQLSLAGLEPDFVQLRLTQGRLSLDLRRRKPGQTFEIDTPNAAFTVENTGYYRIEVDDDVTTFTSRRGGRATLSAASGQSLALAPSEQVVVSGADAGSIESYAAADLDAWDRWNYARSESQVDPVSARYVASGVYGVHELDHYGDWRIVPTYGAIWVPRAVATGWAPYSTGRWLYDPFYGWTWVDAAPWGWAPYHYGRWVHVSSYWGWCPGPIVARPYYAPALVAFFGDGLSLGLSFGGSHVAWVPLGWGEPLVPWWGPPRFRSHPHWAGWSGPRVVNNVVVNRTTVVEVNQLNVYRNVHVKNAVVAVDRDHFGRGRGHEKRFEPFDAKKLHPLRDGVPVAPDRTSLAAASGPARRPPHELVTRSVVATRPPRPDPTPELGEPGRGHGAAPEMEAEKAGGARGPKPRVERAEPFEAPAASEGATTRIVEPPREGKRIKVSTRPPFGRDGDGERDIPPPAPTWRDVAGESPKDASPRPERPGAEPPRTRAPRAETPRIETPRSPAPRVEAPHVEVETPHVGVETPRVQTEPMRVPASERPAHVPHGAGKRGGYDSGAAAVPDLPGEPANRVFGTPPGGPGRGH